MIFPKYKIKLKQKMLGEIVDVVDTLHATAPISNEETKYKMIRTSDIRNGFLNTESMRSVSEETYLKWSRRGKLEVGDVILSREAPMGEVGKISRTDVKYFLGQRTLRLKSTDTNLLTQEFLYQLLKSNYVQKQLRVSEKTGSNVGNIRIPLLKEVILPIPDIPTQRAINNILSTLDDKIELNKKINLKLEDIAQTIYNYWFVDFNFPNEKGNSYRFNGGEMIYSKAIKNEIPKGWKVKKLDDICVDNPKSKIPVKDSLDKGKGKYIFFTSGEKNRSSNKMLVSGSNLFLSTGGNFSVQYMYGNASYSTDTYSINSVFAEYIYYFLLERLDHINKYLFAGSGLKHLQKKELKNLKIVLPKDEIIFDFTNKIRNIFKKIQKNNDENAELEKIRNLLLPLLLNGQVVIEE